jgi:hypothetical protein
MARIFKQPIKSEDGNQNLTSRFVVVVEVVSFTFRFATVAQLRKCIAYYETKTHASSRIPARELADDLGEDWREHTDRPPGGRRQANCFLSTSVASRSSG